MNFKIKLIVAIDTLFLFLLCVSGSSEGAISDALYYTAFLAPILIGAYFIYNADGEKSSAARIAKGFLKDFRFTRRKALLSLPLIFPSVALIFLFSLLTSMLLGAFGYENTSSFNEPFLTAVFLHALIPSVLEELLFRFIPIRLIGENKKNAILISSLMFAFAHANVFQIPYALAAGIIFSLLYLITDSIIPSITLHFINNFISLASIYSLMGKWLIPTVMILAGLSLIFILIMRKKYTSALCSTFKKGERVQINYYPLVFVFISLFLAVTSLIS